MSKEWLEEIRKSIKEIMETPYVVRHKKAKEVGIDLVMTGKADFLLQEIDSLNEENKRYREAIKKAKNAMSLVVGGEGSATKTAHNILREALESDSDE